MKNEPRAETQLTLQARQIHERWKYIRANELKPKQFGVGHGLILITCFAVVFALLRGCVNHSNPQEALALRIEERGGTVTWERSNFHSREQIVTVNMNGRGLPRRLLRELMALPRLREMHLQRCQLRDADVLTMRPTPHLTRIHLGYNQISDKAVSHLATFPNLEAIGLRHCPITDASLHALGNNAPKVWQIRVDDTMVSDRGLLSLSNLKNLRILSLEGTLVSDAGLRCLSNQTTLLEVDLARTTVTQDGVDRLNDVLPKSPARLKSRN